MLKVGAHSRSSRLNLKASSNLTIGSTQIDMPKKQVKDVRILGTPEVCVLTTTQNGVAYILLYNMTRSLVYESENEQPVHLQARESVR